MPRKKKIDGLTAFEVYLENEMDLSRTTARIYAGALRHLVAYLHDRIADSDSVRDFFQDLFEVDEAKCSRTRAAWGYFVEYAKQISPDIDALPAAPSVQSMRRRASSKVAGVLPLGVCEALRGLREDMGRSDFKKLSRFTWMDVDMVRMHRSSKTLIRNPEANEIWAVKSPHVKALFEYAQPGETRSLPLVPESPGSKKSLTPRELKFEVGRYGEENPID